MLPPNSVGVRYELAARCVTQRRADTVNSRSLMCLCFAFVRERESGRALCSEQESWNRQVEHDALSRHPCACVDSPHSLPDVRFFYMLCNSGNCFTNEKRKSARTRILIFSATHCSPSLSPSLFRICFPFHQFAPHSYHLALFLCVAVHSRTRVYLALPPYVLPWYRSAFGVAPSRRSHS